MNKFSVLDDRLELKQSDGVRPKLITAGYAPGEGGLRLAQVCFDEGAHYSSAASDHLLFFHLSAPARITCRVAGDAFIHEARVGAVGICPAGADTSCHGDGTIENLVVALDPAALAIAAVESGVPAPQITERLSGEDRELYELAGILAAECAAGFRNGALYWNDVAANFVHRFLARHTSGAVKRGRGTLSDNVLSDIRDFVNSNLAEPLDIDALARIAGLSAFHFSRTFARSVGVTPHRYVVRTRLRRARELLREGRLSVAEVAAETGFADQSHLSRWIKRVHGATVRQLAES